MRTTLHMTNRTFADAAMGFLAALGNLAARVKAVIRVVSNRRAAQGLADMDDYLLKDLGLTRVELENALSSRQYLDDPSITLAHHAGARVRTQRAMLSEG